VGNVVCLGQGCVYWWGLQCMLTGKVIFESVWCIMCMPIMGWSGVCV